MLKRRQLRFRPAQFLRTIAMNRFLFIHWFDKSVGNRRSPARMGDPPRPLTLRVPVEGGREIVQSALVRTSFAAIRCQPPASLACIVLAALVSVGLAGCSASAHRDVHAQGPAVGQAAAGQPEANANVALSKPAVSSRGKGAEMAVDGRPDTFWSADWWAPQWIELDLLGEFDVENVRLRIRQSEGADETTHLVWVKRENESEWRLFHDFRGSTADGQVLEHSPQRTWTGVRFLRVETVQSNSFVSWNEIQVMGEPSVPAGDPFQH